MKVTILTKIKARVKGSFGIEDLLEVRCADCNKTDTYVIKNSIGQEMIIKYDYWNCSSFSDWTEALKYGAVVTQLFNSNAEVLSRSGEWVKPDSFDHSKLFCTSMSSKSDGVEFDGIKRVICYTFTSIKTGGQYQGRYWFNPKDLSCVSQ